MGDLKVVFRAEYIDVDTGEYITREVSEDELVKMLTWKDTKRRRKVIKEFLGDKIMIFQRVLGKARKELNGTELRVFLYMLEIMDFENWINIPQKEMAKELEISTRLVKSAIKGLREKGYIEVYKKGRENYYRINPEIAWKGDEKSHLKIIRGRNPLID